MMPDLRTLSGHPVSRYAFGTMQWGGNADEAASRALFDDCRAAGINHFDTADVYNGGVSEQILAGFIGDARDHLFLATKAGQDGGCGPDNLRRCLEESRARLRLDVVDLYYMHRWDADTPIARTFETLAEFHQQGLIRHIGVSNYAAWQVMKAQHVAEDLGIRIDVIQPMYNLVKRQAEVEIFPMCVSEDIQPIPYSPLGGGLLTGKYARGETGRLDEVTFYKKRYNVSAMHDTAAALADLADEMGVPAATLAVAWAARHKANPMPIISARSSEQLKPSLDAMTFAMDDALYDRITALSYTPPPATDRLEEA